MSIHLLRTILLVITAYCAGGTLCYKDLDCLKYEFLSGNIACVPVVSSGVLYRSTGQCYFAPCFNMNHPVRKPCLGDWYCGFIRNFCKQLDLDSATKYCE